jgi:Flp pilus assembly pilin Flp
MRSKTYRAIPWEHLWRDSRGQDLIEYALMAGFISVSCLVLLPPAMPILSNLLTAALSKIVNMN